MISKEKKNHIKFKTTKKTRESTCAQVEITCWTSHAQNTHRNRSEVAESHGVIYNHTYTIIVDHTNPTHTHTHTLHSNTRTHKQKQDTTHTPHAHIPSMF